MLNSLRSIVTRHCVGSAPERPVDLDSERWPHFADHIARYAFAMPFAKGGFVVDAGTGPGYGAAMLRAGDASRVIAVDIDPSSIEQAKRNYAERGIEFMVDDCQELSRVPAPVDLICSFENIEHLPQPERFVRAAARLLTPGGMLIVSTPDRAATPPFVNGRPANPHHFHEWYRGEFLELLGQHFAHCELRVQVRSNALEQRRKAAVGLVRHLRRSNPIAWLVGVGTLLLRKPYYWNPIFDLATPDPGDYPILSPALATFYGKSWCHVVLCTSPRQ